MSGLYGTRTFRLSAFGQAVFESHHTDFANGLGTLEEATFRVNGLGDVTWDSPGEIALTNFSTRRAGDRLYVRMFSRRVRLLIPDGINSIVVEAPGYVLGNGEMVSVRSSSQPGPTTSSRLADPKLVAPGDTEIRLVHAAHESSRKRARSASSRAHARRVLTESRDRTLPIASSIGNRVPHRRHIGQGSPAERR